MSTTGQMALALYHALPGRLRSIAASMHGLRLRRLRYGRQTEQLVEAALQRDSWTRERWAVWQAEQLGALLHRAATRVPYYRRLWSERRSRGDRRSWERLENWPILEKEAVRRDARAFVADDCGTRKLDCVHTSGTTGKPIELWRTRETTRAWYALFEARWRRWYGVSRHDRWAILGGQLVTPVAQRRPPFWTWNAALKQLYMSSYHLAPDLVPHYLKAIQRYRIAYLLGYSSSLFALAQTALATNVRTSLRVVITNAEPLLAHQRETIEQAFGCPVRETYGMTEIVAAAGECEFGRLHQWPDAGYLEVLDGDQPASPGCSGELICTGLLNRDMPLIRYRVGDRVTLAASDAVCPCGRTLPLLQSVEGRTDDVLFTADGRTIGRLDPVFKANLPIREAQIIQERLDCIRVRFVPAADYTPAAGQGLIDRLRDRLGLVQVVLEDTDSIERDRNGKFRAVVCAIPAQERPDRCPTIAS
jgi:phenylacetate-CoA ligase